MKTPAGRPAETFTKHVLSGFSLPCDGNRGRDYLTTAVIGVFLVLAVFLAIRIVMHVGYPYAVDTGEGCVLASMWRAASGLPVYGIVREPPYYYNIYNPVLVYLGGLMMYIFGPAPSAARMITVAFYAGSALAIYLFIRRETASKAAALVAALFFLVERHIFSRAGYAVTDWPGLFFSLLGLYLWRGAGKSRYWAVLAFVLAFFSKQSSVTAAAAAFLSLFLEGRRLASIRYFAVFVAGTAVGVAICGLLFGKAYFVNTFQYVGVAPLEIQRSIRHVGVALALYIAAVGAWAQMAVRSMRDRRLLLPVLYAFFGLLLAFSSGRVGASRSYTFDFAAALSLIVGLTWPRVTARARSGRFRALVVGATSLQMILVAVGALYGFRVFGDKTASDLAHDSAISAAFMTREGVILCREQGFEVGAKAENVANDVYKTNQLIKAGVFSREILLAPVRRREFSMVIMPKKEGPWIFFTEDLRQEVYRNYVIDHEAYGEEFLVPRTDASR